MPVLRHGLDPLDDTALQKEQRLGVPLPEGFQHLQSGNIVDVYIGSVKDLVDLLTYHRHLIVLPGGVGVDLPVEFRNLLRLEGKPCRHSVAAVFFQQPPAGMDGLEHGEKLHAPGGAGGRVPVDGKDDVGLSVKPQDLGGNDPHHPVVEPLCRNDHDPVELFLRMGGNGVLHLGEDDLLFLLPTGVHPVQLLRQLGGLLRILAQKELHG